MPLDVELKRILDAAVDDLTAVARQECDRAHENGVAEGRRQAQQESRDAVEAAVAAARAERSSDLAASERLLDAVRVIDAARSLSEILDTLAGCAGREAARAAVLLVRGDRLRGWRFVGFPALDGGPTVELTLADAGVIAEAVRSGNTASGETGAHAGPPPFADLQAGHESLAIPIVMASQVVAVLYADQGHNLAPLPPGIQPPAWPEALEVLARHAARCLEALTAIKAARALTERPDLDAQAHPGSVDAGRALDASSASRDSDAEEATASARRYAKLLVSEIKLYHEAAVIAGRRERDLATRLGGEISRARALYEQRVPAAVRQRADYFQDELVRTLANGDATLLQLT